MATHSENPSSIGTPAAVLRPGRYAAIDIGTVTCRMLVVDISEEGNLHELRRECTITNLGEGVDASGTLLPEAMQRVANAIARYRAILNTYELKTGNDITVMAVATSAARDARNSDEFVALLAQAGITLSVIPGEREAALSFAGASCDFTGERILVVDVGGGSTELIAGNAGGVPLQTHSFNIGCRRVTEKFLKADPPSHTELEQARTWIATEMRPYFENLRASGFVPERVVAVAGTATSVVSVHEGMAEYDASRVHRSVVERSVLDKVYAQLAGVGLEERRRTVGLEPDRAPVIVAGVVVLQVVLDLAGMPSFTVSESDILHGMVLEAARTEA